jgi:hypothetical protein
MERKDIYLGLREQASVEVIIKRGYAESTAGAVRIALRVFADALKIAPPIATPSTP